MVIDAALVLAFESAAQTSSRAQEFANGTAGWES
jgi:hypothetical protein